MKIPLRAGVIVGLVVGGGGCTNARDEFTDFGDRLVDASTVEIDGAIVSELPDATGEWFMVVRPDLPEDRFMYFRVSWTFAPVTENTGTLAYSGVCLDVNTFAEVEPPMEEEGIAVANDASFDAPLIGPVAGQCNPVTGTTIQANGTLHGTLLTADFMCGDASGEASGLSLEGTVWAAQRITGDTLPEPIWNCDGAPPAP